MNWFLFWLFLHIIAAVIAFGPVFVFPLVAALVRRHPDHLPFAMELDHAVGTRLVLPVALTMPVSGVGLLVAAHVDVLQSVYLLVAIGLYLVMIGLAVGFQYPGGRRLVELTRAAEPGTAPASEVVHLIARARNVGIVLTMLLIAIVFLMIIKPGGLVSGPLFG